MTTKDAIVVANGLRKQFTTADGSPFLALTDVSLTVNAGELTALVGSDGSGKSTLLRMVAGLLKPDSGSLNVLGIDVLSDPQSVQDRISYMPQRFGLYEDLSVQENLDLYADLHGVPQALRRERFSRMLAMTDLARFTDRPAGKLSGGMKQKLGLACTLVRSPDLLLLDEPSVGVDPLSRRELWKIIQQLVSEEQLSVIVSTAYMDEAERCDHIYVMHHGLLLAEGTPDSLRERARGLTYVASPPADMPSRTLQARLMDASNLIIDAVPRGGEVAFIRHPEGRDEDIDQLLNDVQARPRQEELEDTIMLMMRQQEQSLTSGPQTLPTQLVAVNGKTGGEIILVRDLVRKFGDFTAVASTSFNVSRGEIFGLLGPNGAGKTTTFRMLCGLLPATSGHLEVAGLNLRTTRAKGRSRIGYVAQRFSLYRNLTVRQNLEFYGGTYGLRSRALRQRIQTLESQFELDPAARSEELPAGYKQRLAMAASLLHEPDILFLDEPTSGIDPQARRLFWRMITALAEGGVTIIVTTHFMEEAEYCDRIAIQDAGRLLALGTPGQVRQFAGGEHIADMNNAFIAIVEQSRVARVRTDGEVQL